MNYCISMKRITLMLALLPLAVFSGGAQDEGPAETEYINGDKVFIENPKWHEKEGGKWLFTCRLEAAAERLVKPIAHLHFYRLGESEEVVWEHKAIVRRNKFDKSYGSRKASFIRAMIDDLPADIGPLTVEFKNEPPNANK